MGQIVSSAAKPKRCNLNKLSQLGTPAAGEYILVSSDNSMNAAGQGNFDCYIEGDGQKAATELELKSVDGFTELDGKVTDLNVGRIKLSITETGKYIPTNTGVGNAIGSVTTGASYYYIRHSVNPGDILIVNATGGYAPRAWCFIDSNQKIISVCEATIVNGIVLVAPENATEIIINSETSDTRSSYYMDKEALWETSLNNDADILALRREYDSLIGMDTTKTNVSFSLQGYYTATTGTFTANTSAKCTPLTSLDGYNVIEYCGLLSPAGAVLSFFDANNNHLQELAIPGVGSLVSGRIVLNKNYTQAKYVAASVYGSSFFDYAFLRLCKSAPDSIDEQLARTKPIAESFDTLIKNTNFSNNAFIGINGAITASDSYRCTDFIKLDKANKIHLYGLWSGGSSVIICFYDKNKTKVGDTYNSIDASTLEYVIPSIPTGAVFVRCGTRLSNLSASSYVRIENETGAVIDAVMPLSIVSERSRLNVLIFGDSISDCTNITIANDKTTAYSWHEPSNRYTNSQGVRIGYYMWPYFVNKILNCFDCRCYAFQGASYRTMQREAGYERRNLQYQIQVALNDINNPNNVFPTIGTFIPDIVFLALGVNDGSPSSSETYALTMAKTVFSDGIIDVDATLAALDFSNKADAIHGAFLQIKKYFPYALTFTVLPIQREADSFDQSNSISELIRQLAHRYSIHVIDGARDMGIVRELCSDVDIYLKDGLHPNDKGQNLYTRLILSAIKKEWIDMSVLNPEPPIIIE